MAVRQWLLAIALLAILTVAYWPVFGAGFCPWDDLLYTADNPLVKNGLTFPAAVGAFTSTWENNWSPVFWIFLAAQVSLAGGISPAVFHAASVCLCLANAFLLGWVARRFALPLPIAMIVAALFALHPLRVEAVAWISAQKHLLAAVFLLAALLFYQEALRRDFGKFFALSLASFALSLMSSQIGVGLPVFLFLWEAGRVEAGPERWRNAAFRSTGFFFLAGGAALTTLWVNWRPEAQAVAWFDHPLPHRLLQATGSLGWQALAWLWPTGLAAFYPWPGARIWLYAAVGGALLVAVAALAWRVRLRGGLALAGLAGFLACFFPVSGVLALPISFTADRLSYIPSLFLALALGAALDSFLKRGWRVPVLLCGAWALALAPLTFLQARHWKDEKTIVARTLSLYPDSIPARINEAALSGMEGRLEEALARFEKIREIEPLHEVVWSNEIALLKKLGRQDDALERGREAVRRIPKSIPLNYQMGLELAERNRPAEALEYFRQARALSPQSVQPAFQCARMLTQLGEVKEALSLLQLLELSLQGDPAYWNLRAEAHDRNGDWESVKRSREAAARLSDEGK